MLRSRKKRQEAGGLKDKREELRGKGTRGCKTSLKWKCLWHKKDCELSSERRCCGTEERCLRKRVTSLENTRLCMKKIA